MIVTENELDDWVRSHARLAEGAIVELLYRLVLASCPQPSERRFPLPDSVGQSGRDGYLVTEPGYPPFVPDGPSVWECGTGLDPHTKATADYKARTDATPDDKRQLTTFIFVTPLSGRRVWNDASQETWLKDRRDRKEWKAVHIIDGTKLIDWMHQFPAVSSWLATQMGLPGDKAESPLQRWEIIKKFGDPPPLTPHLFLANRAEACEKMKELFSKSLRQVKFDTHHRDQVPEFIAAYVASLDRDIRMEIDGRCLIVSDAGSWAKLTALRTPHFMIADFDLDAASAQGNKILQQALNAGHVPVYGGMPGGIPHPHRVAIPSPKGYQIKEALEKAGYKEERARNLSVKAGGNLSSLLRCLQNLSMAPEWAQGGEAAELAIAMLLGAWNEGSAGDKAEAEELSGNAFGEWIAELRKVALRPGTPLTLKDGLWKVVARYEGWYAVGGHIHDEHLDRFRKVAARILSELDPKFELEKEERYAASLHGKVLPHSKALRAGIAETLALLGAHPSALVSCSFSKAEGTAVLAVRDIFKDAGWQRWASLDSLLPMLAEAAPTEFLTAVEDALLKKPSVFEDIFAQESNGVMGANYMTGVLWALETLAWDAKLLGRVTLAFGALAELEKADSNWGNKPSNSLATIFLPWLPQTCATSDQRKAAIETLLKEHPAVGWKVLVSLLPQVTSTSSYTHKPSWRTIIPEDWTSTVSNRAYWDEVSGYAVLAVQIAQDSVEKLCDLIQHLDNLPGPARDRLLDFFKSAAAIDRPEKERLRIWNALKDLAANHRQHSEAGWALPTAEVEKIESVAAILAPAAPSSVHRRLFTEQDFRLLDRKGSYDDQYARIEEKRKAGLSEILAGGGHGAILAFAEEVEAPFRVGITYSKVVDQSHDAQVLPGCLANDGSAKGKFAAGYVAARFRALGWAWVDSLSVKSWAQPQQAALLLSLPFEPGTWERVVAILGLNESEYWKKTTANPYEADDKLDFAIDKLIEHRRPNAAVWCLEKLVHKKLPLDSDRVIRALTAVLQASDENPKMMDAHNITDLIGILQDDSKADRKVVANLEWQFLPLLDGYHGKTKPRLLEAQLAESPDFFCEAIRAAFKSKMAANEEKPPDLSDAQKGIARNTYTLLGAWKRAPGVRDDGTFDGKALDSWLKAVLESTHASGHSEIAQEFIGRVLTYAPPDPDGLWIHSAAAAALDAPEAKEMRDGFTTGMFNKRGVHGFTSGKEEAELAEQCDKMADPVAAKGFQRLAGALRELAESYRRDAARQKRREPFDD